MNNQTNKKRTNFFQWRIISNKRVIYVVNNKTDELIYSRGLLKKKKKKKGFKGLRV